MSRRATLTTAAPATVDPVFQTTLPDFTQGEQTYIDKVKELEDRFTKPKTGKKQRKVTKRKIVKTLKKRAFNPSDIIKGSSGVPVKKNTTLRSLIRGVWWGRKPLLTLLGKHIRLVDGQFFNKRTTLLSLMRNLPKAKKPLVDVIVNKML